jgi:hypothetical protein
MTRDRQSVTALVGGALRARSAALASDLRLAMLARQVAHHSPKRTAITEEKQTSYPRPVAIFNATARIQGLSQNAAFGLLTGWGLRLAGFPLVHFVCQSGMKPCVLGTNREDVQQAPPCQACIRRSRRLYAAADVHWFNYHPDPDLEKTIQGLNVASLCQFEYTFPTRPPSPSVGAGRGDEKPGFVMPLGRLVLPAVRWALRIHTLPDDEPTRILLREYILSAYNVAQEFAVFLDQHQPACVLIFNGIMYPEATARWVAQKRAVRVITYEVGFQRFSAFFTEGDATAYPIAIPQNFELSPAQNTRLDEYLEKRFKGQFTMAGIRFWPEMRGLDQAFLEKAAAFKQIVAVFTNVVYDTSQVHANTVFPHMFAWLDAVLEIIHSHADTLFVIRAHPDEMRPGTRKVSRETVAAWVERNGVDRLPNVVFIGSQEYLSSYELIQRSSFVMVYNSSIGLEAALMGAAVLCAGKARYTQYPTVFFPGTQAEFKESALRLLDAAHIQVPAEFQYNARRFLYYQLFRASLSFEEYLTEDENRKGFARLRHFSWQQLLPENSATMSVLVDGIGKPGNTPAANQFLIEETL